MPTPEEDRCPATGSLTVNGEVVAAVPCMLPAGHDERWMGIDNLGRVDSVEGTPHAWGIEWTDPPAPRLVALVVDECEGCGDRVCPIHDR